MLADIVMVVSSVTRYSGGYNCRLLGVGRNTRSSDTMEKLFNWAFLKMKVQ